MEFDKSRVCMAKQERAERRCQIRMFFKRTRSFPAHKKALRGAIKLPAQHGY